MGPGERPGRIGLEEHPHARPDEVVVEHPLVVRALPPLAVQRVQRRPAFLWEKASDKDIDSATASVFSHLNPPKTIQRRGLFLLRQEALQRIQNTTRATGSLLRGVLAAHGVVRAVQLAPPLHRIAHGKAKTLIIAPS